MELAGPRSARSRISHACRAASRREIALQQERHQDRLEHQDAQQQPENAPGPGDQLPQLREIRPRLAARPTAARSGC